MPRESKDEARELQAIICVYIYIEVAFPAKLHVWGEADGKHKEEGRTGTILRGDHGVYLPWHVSARTVANGAGYPPFST